MTIPGNSRNNDPQREYVPVDQTQQTQQPQQTQQTQQPVAPSHAASGPAHAESVPLRDEVTTRGELASRQKEEFGGMKFGSAFFGWLTATGTAVLLTALVAAIGAVVGLGNNVTGEEATDAAAQNADTVGIVGAIALIVILLLAYYCGGYVAGRMARFSGLKQGIAVWLWAVIIAVVVAIVTAIAGSQFNILGNLNSFPRIPLGEGELTTASIITAVLLAAASLIGAMLGGLAGMRYHRKIDRVSLEH